MVSETAVIIGFGIAILFLVYLGNRVGQKKEVIPRVVEGAAYSFAGLLVTVMLFLLAQFTEAAAYGGVVNTVFVIFQILLGLLSSIGAIAFSIILVTLGLAKIVRGVKK